MNSRGRERDKGRGEERERTYNPAKKEGKRLNYKNSSSKETVLLIKCIRIRLIVGTFRVVQRLRPHTPNTGGPGSVPGTRSHMPQLRFCTPQQRSKILHAAAKTQIYILQSNK